MVVFAALIGSDDRDSEGRTRCPTSIQLLWKHGSNLTLMFCITKLISAAHITNVCQLFSSIASSIILKGKTFYRHRKLYSARCALPYPAVRFHSSTICPEARCQVSKSSTEMNKEAFPLLLLKQRSKPTGRVVMDSDV